MTRVVKLNSFLLAYTRNGRYGNFSLILSKLVHERSRDPPVISVVSAQLDADWYRRTCTQQRASTKSNYSGHTCCYV